jgi:hypothetical protein
MSSDEEKAIIGGLVIEYGEAKRRVIALELEASRIGRTLMEVGKALEQPALMVQRAPIFEQNLSALPERQVIVDLIEEMRAARRRRDELQKSMKEYGLLDSY